MDMNKVRINYDKFADVLYILLGPSRPSYAEEVDDGFYIRYDMETDEITGITILDFSKRGLNDIAEIISAENIMSKEEVGFLSTIQ
jgi:uncharacterized protein YuzE